MKKDDLIQWLQLLLIILLVVGAGLFAINQGLGYFYKSRFLQGPCSLCKELNPGLDQRLVLNITPYNISSP